MTPYTGNSWLASFSHNGGREVLEVTINARTMNAAKAIVADRLHIGDQMGTDCPDFHLVSVTGIGTPRNTVPRARLSMALLNAARNAV